MAVATHTEGYSTIKEIIPGLAFHAVSLFLGMVLMGLGQKFKKTGVASRGNVVGLVK